MRVFHPVIAPPGRLVRLGIVVDQRNDAKQIMRVAQMAERAGMQSLWVADRLITKDGQPRMEAWTALTIASLYTSKIRVGGMFMPGLRTPQSLAAMVGSLDALLEGRMELGVGVGWDAEEFAALGLPFADDDERIDGMEEFVRLLMRLVTGQPATGNPSSPSRAMGIGVVSPQAEGPPLTIELRHPSELNAAVALADNVLLPAMAISELAGMIQAARAACERSDRDPDSLGLAVELPVSVGRTDAESDVRVEIDDLLSQMDTRAIGIHGKLEHCQDIVIELAHLGVADVRCVLPNVADIDDVIAQLSATSVGTKDVLKPGTARSEAPAPPPGWGAPTGPKTASTSDQ
ncbi:MAG TPA: LLM class flavin-dependent oxidoreductase [Acidimicrobiia bacterium]|nr:LLM class flavin-dependent oxidoreductase [Acidimicrobiia bacterium]